MASAKCSSNAGRILASDVPIFRWPTSGPLLDIVEAWRNEGIAFVDGFHKLIQENYKDDNANSLFLILKQIRDNFLHKKGRKRVDKFVNLIKSRKNISLKNLSILFVGLIKFFVIYKVK